MGGRRSLLSADDRGMSKGKGEGKKTRAALDAPVFLCLKKKKKKLLIPSSLTKAKQRIPFIQWSVFYL